MSLLNGIVLFNLDESKKVSQHSMLMKFYKLDKEIAEIEDARFEKWMDEDFTPPKKWTKKQQKERDAELSKEYHSWDLALYFMRFEAFSIYQILNGAFDNIKSEIN